MRLRKGMITEWGIRNAGASEGELRLTGGSRVAVIGGGPAGSFFCCFLLEEAERLGFTPAVDLYEPKDYSRPGPGGCNHCGGVISESLVQILAAEGINLPPSVVQRGIDSYTLHTEEGTVRIETPLNEKRIAAVSRGAGPRGTTEARWDSFDRYLQNIAVERGARVVREAVSDLEWQEGRPLIRTRSGLSEPYDLVAVATGVNSNALKKLEKVVEGYRPPRDTRTYICEIPLGADTVEECIGSSMHVFLPNIPAVQFAALIPKGGHVTLCLLGEGIDESVVQSLLRSHTFRRCVPPEWIEEHRMCQCHPKINIGQACAPGVDRIVFLGDALTTRLYKDGIGGAYRAAKGAANTAVFHGLSAADFERWYAPVCHAIDRDNAYGRVIFDFTRRMRGWPPMRRAILRMTAREQLRKNTTRRMSVVLWDLFTGSAPYREVLMRFFQPLFALCFFWNLVLSILPFQTQPDKGDVHGSRSLGKSISSR